MIYSFIGLGKPISAVNNILQTHIKNYRKSHFGEMPVLTPGGVFASNLTAAAKFAGDNDMCVYMSVNDLLEKSDIIFVFLNDKALKNISVTFGKVPVKGKIFCHFSPAFSADILDFNSANTYLSLYLPYITKDGDGHSLSKHIIAEGYGKNVDRFKEAMQLLSVKCSFVGREERLMYLTAVNLVKDMPRILKYTAAKLMKYALAGDKELCSELMDIAMENPEALSSYDPVESDDADFAENQCKVLKFLGIDDITKLYAVLLGAGVNMAEPSEASERIKAIAKRTLEQK